jgi:hypothetical protein
MKTIIKSIWRPLCRALCTLLIGIAALLAMPRNARAPVLYVGQSAINSVGEYNATTGAAINANYITGLNDPAGLAVSGNDLFVVNYGADTVGEYNAKPLNFGSRIPTLSRSFSAEKSYSPSRLRCRQATVEPWATA